MKIAIITYNNAHRKTQDVLAELLKRGYDDITLVAIPWVKFKRPKDYPLFQHRPTSCENILPQNLAQRHGCKFFHYPLDRIHEILAHIQPDKVLIGGCGIVPVGVFKQSPHAEIINSHPGWLPNVRGLDAFKWAIYEDELIGCTTYKIDVEADTGWLIEQRETPIKEDDDIKSLAKRHYNLEIEMLCDAVELPIRHDKLGDRYIFKGHVPAHSIVHKRMPREKEKYLNERLIRKIVG